MKSTKVWIQIKNLRNILESPWQALSSWIYHIWCIIYDYISYWRYKIEMLFKHGVRSFWVICSVSLIQDVRSYSKFCNVLFLNVLQSSESEQFFWCLNCVKISIFWIILGFILKLLIYLQWYRTKMPNMNINSNRGSIK